ncbi:MAG: hypothetical protein DRH57_07965 [Candidatus Cloacimonadota bacterium]|nr:MAG: hypothetical protein DRH57_07965 [Candidatus Cloacimonadota bacterium]
MNIKDRTVKMRIPNIFFNRTYSNGVMLILLSFALINYIWGNMGHSSFNMMQLFLINFSFIFVAVIGAAGPGEALKEPPSYSNDEDTRVVNMADFKKMGIYLVVYIVCTLTMNALFSPVYVPPKPNIDKHIQIKSVKFIDVHEKGEDIYAIRYYDKDGQNIFTDRYTKEPSRMVVYNKIFDKAGKVIVDMDYYEKKGKAFVEISARAIQLN